MSKTQQNWLAIAAVVFSFAVSSGAIIYGYGALNTRVYNAEECCKSKANAEYVHEAFDNNALDHARLTRAHEETQKDIKEILRRLPQPRRARR